MTTSKPEPMLFLSDARGIYIPRDFATGIRHDCVTGVTDGDWHVLESGPEHELYWDTWADVESNATVRDPDTGIEYRIYQDGDCFLIPVGMEFDEVRGFYWPESGE